MKNKCFGNCPRCLLANPRHGSWVKSQFKWNQHTQLQTHTRRSFLGRHHGTTFFSSLELPPLDRDILLWLGRRGWGPRGYGWLRGRGGCTGTSPEFGIGRCIGPPGFIDGPSGLPPPFSGLISAFPLLYGGCDLCTPFAGLCPTFLGSAPVSENIFRCEMRKWKKITIKSGSLKNNQFEMEAIYTCNRIAITATTKNSRIFIIISIFHCRLHLYSFCLMRMVQAFEVRFHISKQ